MHIVRGDEEALGRLWCDLQPRLLRYFAVPAPAAAEDLASETWLAVVRSLDRFQGNEPSFRAWVFTIARHEVLDWRRRAARRPATDQPVNGLVGRAAPDDPAATALEGLFTRAALAYPWYEAAHAVSAYEHGEEFDILHDHTGPVGVSIGAMGDCPTVHTCMGRSPTRPGCCIGASPAGTGS